MCDEPNIEFVPTIARSRMYDPVMSSFLSPDNYVQSPDFSQSFNRYSYCWNNPLKYTDPSGELIGIDDIIIGAAIGIMFNTTMQALTGNINSASDMHTAMFVGALSGAAGAWAGGEILGAMPKTGGFYAGAASGAAGGAAGGFIGNAAGAWYNGASFGNGLLAGFVGAGIGAFVGGVVGGLSRGFEAKRRGFDFWDGHKFVNIGKPGLKLHQLYPNYRFNPVDYANNSEFADLRLNLRAKYSFGDVGSNIKTKGLSTSLTSKMIKDGYSMACGGWYIQNGEAVYGTTFWVDNGYTEIHISPWAATHPNQAIFEATLGHEYTHAYNFYTQRIGKFPDITDPNSEYAAVDFTAATYDNYGMNGVANAYRARLNDPARCLYNVNAIVPGSYSFSKESIAPFLSPKPVRFIY